MKNLPILLKGVVVVLLIAFVYSITPRVFLKKSAYGVEIPKVDFLSSSVKQEVATTIEKANKMQTVVVVYEGQIIFEEGDTSQLINTHSIRKSIISLLFGIAQEEGFLSIDETLGELGIDESKTPLTTQEKSATIRDLLRARSGVFIPAEGESESTKNNRPEREQYKPGEFFLYNNFDFNVLGAILEQKTGMSLGDFMQEHLAEPIGMQDFVATNVVYGSPWPVPNDTDSDYQPYWIFLSARDLAKIGILMAQNGQWEQTQVVSSAWIEESTLPYEPFNEPLYEPYDNYGYLWWLEYDTNTIWADGYGGQYLLIDSAKNLIVLQRNFTGNSLFTSGLFFMDENRDNSRKSDLLRVYEQVNEYIELKNSTGMNQGQ